MCDFIFYPPGLRVGLIHNTDSQYNAITQQEIMQNGDKSITLVRLAINTPFANNIEKQIKKQTNNKKQKTKQKQPTKQKKNTHLENYMASVVSS